MSRNKQSHTTDTLAQLKLASDAVDKLPTAQEAELDPTEVADWLLCQIFRSEAKAMVATDNSVPATRPGR
jgi:hypothetical protein